MKCAVCGGKARWWVLDVPSSDRLCLRCEVWSHHEMMFLAMRGPGTPIRRLVMDRKGLMR